MSSILSDWYDTTPRIFTSEDLARAANLFRDRTALYFTPTADIPSEWVGNGRLDVVLPLAAPTAYDYGTNLAYRVPKLWVDMLQRATGKLRWLPISHPKVTIVRYDTNYFDHFAVVAGAKAVMDAVIVKAAGLRDGHILHYFGAIQDDNINELSCAAYYQVIVDSHTEAKTRIVVEEDPDHVTASSRLVSYGPDQVPPP